LENFVICIFPSTTRVDWAIALRQSSPTHNLVEYLRTSLGKVASSSFCRSLATARFHPTARCMPSKRCSWVVLQCPFVSNDVQAPGSAATDLCRLPKPDRRTMKLQFCIFVRHFRDGRCLPDNVRETPHMGTYSQKGLLHWHPYMGWCTSRVQRSRELASDSESMSSI